MINSEPVVNQVRTSGSLTETSYHIAPEATLHIEQMLRNMYSDPVLAVIREYSANAVDAHVQAGCPDRPIEVTLPTTLQPVFSVRDYGPGLNRADTEKLLYGYGASGAHKRTSNDSIGGFGIGCKCGFAIAAQFTYTIWHAGRKATWVCFKDEHDRGKASLLSDEIDVNNEPSGVLVSIPVASDQVKRFLDRISTAYTYYAVQPRVRHGPEGKDVVSLIQADRPLLELAWQVENVPVVAQYTPISESNNEQMLQVVMGGLAYPVNLDLAGAVSHSYSENRWLHCWTLRLPIGALQLAPNREALQYSPYVIRMLSTIIGLLKHPDQVKKCTSAVLANLSDLLQRYSLGSLVSLLRDLETRQKLSDIFDCPEAKALGLTGRDVRFDLTPWVNKPLLAAETWIFEYPSYRIRNRYLTCDRYDIRRTSVHLGPYSTPSDTAGLFCKSEVCLASTHTDQTTRVVIMTSAQAQTEETKAVLADRIWTAGQLDAHCPLLLLYVPNEEAAIELRKSLQAAHPLFRKHTIFLESELPVFDPNTHDKHKFMHATDLAPEYAAISERRTRSRGPRTVYAQTNKKLLSFDKAVATPREPRDWWKPVSEPRQVTGGVYVSLDRYFISSPELGPNTLSSPENLGCFLRLKQCEGIGTLYGVRMADLDKMKTGWISLVDWMKTELRKRCPSDTDLVTVLALAQTELFDTGSRRRSWEEWNACGGVLKDTDQGTVMHDKLWDLAKRQGMSKSILYHKLRDYRKNHMPRTTDQHIWATLVLPEFIRRIATVSDSRRPDYAQAFEQFVIRMGVAFQTVSDRRDSIAQAYNTLWIDLTRAYPLLGVESYASRSYRYGTVFDNLTREGTTPGEEEAATNLLIAYFRAGVREEKEHKEEGETKDESI